MPYIPGLDGLRALSVALVLLFHARVPGLPGANVGVDLFLVLSGFLITALLLDEQARSGSIALKRFYLRRAWRLMPALLLLLALYALCAPWLWPDYPFHLRDGLGMLLYVTNLAMATGNTAEKLLHGWSLGLEEQFYLLWPCLLLGWRRLVGRLALWQALLGLYGVLYLWRLWCLQGAGVALDLAYYRPDLHVGGLLLGAALAAWWRSRETPGVPVWMGPVGWLLVLVAVLVPQSESAHLLLYMPLAEVGAVLLITAIVVGRQSLFAEPLVTHLGRLSYGLYLFHFPVMLYLVECRLHWALVFVLGSALAYVLAWLSFHTLEAAARRYRERRWPAALACAS